MSTTMWAVTAAVVYLLSVPTQSVPAQECGGTITEDGVFLSPDPFEERYKKQESMECVWRIEAPEDKRAVLKISKYSLNKAISYCNTNSDYIAVYDGLRIKDEKRLAILCSKGQDFVIPSSENTLTVKFKTQSFNDMTGFIAKIIFTYPESAGCGEHINLSDSSYLLKSPRIRNYEEGDSFECIWNFVAPEDHAIKVSFSLFEKFTCKYNHLLEIRDGNTPDSLILGTFCGKKLPPVIVSSSNRLSIRMSSSEKSRFIATVGTTRADCTPYLNYVFEEHEQYKSPGFDSGTLPRGLHCGHQFWSNNNYYPVRLTIKNLDIQPGTEAGKCDKDKLILGTRSNEDALGKYYSSNYDTFNYLVSTSKLNSMYDKYSYLARQFEICGKKTVEFYFPGTFYLNLITAPGDEDTGYKGFEIDVSYAMFCGRNYTEPYGRILSGPGGSLDDCYTLISAPEGHTISLYFLSFQPEVMSNIVYVEVYDGKTTEASKIMSTENDQNITVYNIPKPIFSTSNYLLIKNKRARFSQTSFDANYMITNKGLGCGGYYYADQGVFTSPLYPETYKEAKSCEWEIETPVSTLLHLTFDEFDLTGDCTSNYVELVGRDGKVLSKYCSEKPGNFKSNDNYVKIVYVTGPSNNGKGWHAMFRAGECLRCRRHR